MVISGVLSIAEVVLYAILVVLLGTVGKHDSSYVELYISNANGPFMRELERTEAPAVPSGGAHTYFVVHGFTQAYYVQKYPNITETLVARGNVVINVQWQELAASPNYFNAVGNLRTVVLDEIISVLISPQLINEITKPQAPYTHEALKNLVEDVTQSSAMRLDCKSMDKLWDLITMVFKWQISLSTDILKLTARHLYEIENYVTTEETQLQLHKIQNLFDNYEKILNKNEKIELRDALCAWLNEYSVRVSLLMRLGLQDMDGNFIVDDLEPFAEDMLRNLGENIYTTTQNGKLYKSIRNAEKGDENVEGFELKLLAEQILGEKKMSSESSMLKLAIQRKDEENRNVTHFDNVKIERNCNELGALFDELNLSERVGNCDDFHDDLINMIGNDN